MTEPTWIQTQMALVSQYLHRQEQAQDPSLPVAVKHAMQQIINALDVTLDSVGPAGRLLEQFAQKNEKLYERLLTAEEDVRAREKRNARRRVRK